MTGDAFERVIERLDGVRRSGSGASARCPAHDDTHPSLSIGRRTQGDPGAVLHCHAGCSTAEVVAAIGLTMVDLYDDPRRAREPGSAADDRIEYPYFDESGELLFTVVRRPGKRFHQEPASGRTGAGAMDGVRRVLYRLPSVIDAVQRGDVIFIVEGEKDADRLVAEGVCATTSPQGARKWSLVAGLACEVLAGADVVVIADRDDAGRAHARDVVECLQPVVRSIVVREAAKGKDVSEHLAAGLSLDRLVDAGVDEPGPRPEADAKSTSMRDQLVELAEDQYTIGRTEDDRPFIVPDFGANVALLGAPAKRSLGARFREVHGRAPGRTPLDEAWTIIEGLALEADKQPLPLRMARDDDGLIIDLGDASGTAVVFTAAGWQVVERSPVTFRRSKAMLPLPVPVRGASATELFELLAVDPASQDLLLAWHAAAFIEDMPHPIVVLRGPQGSTKSTTSRAISKLLDPCMADTQKPPGNENSWEVACSSRWCVAVDNVSNIADWWSDALCRAVTGAGWARRALYTDDDEAVTKYRRCIVLNGITLGGVMRADLQERLMAFDLTRPHEYMTDRDVDRRLDEMRPRVFGGLLDMLVLTLGAFEHVQAVTDLRMADFATFLRAFDHANRTNAEAQYRQQQQDAWADAYEADEFAQTVVAFAKARVQWVGTMAELLPDLDALYRTLDGTQFASTPTHWPKTPHGLSSWLARSAVTLQRAGVEYEQLPRTSTGRPHRLRYHGVGDAQ